MIILKHRGICTVMDGRDEIAMWKNHGSRTQIINIPEVRVYFIYIGYRFGRTLVHEI